jgi:dihydroorotase
LIVFISFISTHSEFSVKATCVCFGALSAMPDVVGRAIVMPNLKPPVTTTELALEYLGRITAALPEGSTFQVFVNTQFE